MLDNSSKTNISPVIYADEYYDDYLICHNIDKVIEKAAKTLLNHYVPKSNINLDAPKSHIAVVLVNYEQNKEKLKDIYHIKFHDMAIVFRLILKITDEGTFGCLVTNEMLSAFGISTENLLETAKENTKKLLPVKIELMSDKYNRDFPTSKDIPALLLTNKYRVEGAAYILYKDLLNTIKNVLKSDFYIIPASIHEVMLIPKDCSTAEELRQILHIVSSDVIKKEDILSENIYLFDGSLKLLQ